MTQAETMTLEAPATPEAPTIPAVRVGDPVIYLGQRSEYPATVTARRPGGVLTLEVTDDKGRYIQEDVPYDPTLEMPFRWCLHSEMEAVQAAAKAAELAYAEAHPPAPPRIEPPAPPPPFTDGRPVRVDDLVSYVVAVPGSLDPMREVIRTPARIVAVARPDDPRSPVDLEVVNLHDILDVPHRDDGMHSAVAWAWLDGDRPGFCPRFQPPREGEKVLVRDARRVQSREATVRAGVVLRARAGMTQWPRIDVRTEEPEVIRDVSYNTRPPCWRWPDLDSGASSPAKPAAPDDDDGAFALHSPKTTEF